MAQNWETVLSMFSLAVGILYFVLAAQLEITAVSTPVRSFGKKTAAAVKVLRPPWDLCFQGAYEYLSELFTPYSLVSNSPTNISSTACA
jgi:hypothetical protein